MVWTAECANPMQRLRGSSGALRHLLQRLWMLATFQWHCCSCQTYQPDGPPERLPMLQNELSAPLRDWRKARKWERCTCALQARQCRFEVRGRNEITRALLRNCHWQKWHMYGSYAGVRDCQYRPRNKLFSLCCSQDHINLVTVPLVYYSRR